MNGFEYYVGGIFGTNPMAQDIEFRITEGVVSPRPAKCSRTELDDSCEEPG